MSGIFGVISKGDCAETLLHGTDYHSHLGTEYGGMAIAGKDFTRRIHNISQSQFKSKFYESYREIKGNKGIGVISDCDEQPIYLNSKFGPFCLVSAGLIENKEELALSLLAEGVSFSEVASGGINSTELVAKLISRGNNLIEGIENMFASI
ncbi:MAG: amidophosphoribosyltransferase, partial [Candidatus Omnitrophota bacterium]